MPRNAGWSRRNFVQMLGTAAIASRASALGLFSNAEQHASLSDGTILFVGRESEDSGAIEVMASRNGRLQTIQRIQSERPAAISVAKDRRSLYVVNEVAQYEGLPRGTAEAYSISKEGRLALLGRQPLSLSATLPQHAALSPDGRSLAVTSRDGGVINTLPVLEDGSLGRIDGIYKFTGDASGRTAQPHAIAFDAEHRIISIDSGTGSARVLRRNEGNLTAHAHTLLQEDKATTQMALHHEAAVIYLASENGIECYGYDSKAGQLTDRRQFIGQSALDVALHPSGRFVFTSHRKNGLTPWSINRKGELQSVDRDRSAGVANAFDAIEVTPDGRSLLAISSITGTIAHAAIDPLSGRLGSLQTLAQLDSPRSIAAIYA